MEVGDYEVGVVEHQIRTGVGQRDACDAADHEQEDKAKRVEHGDFELDRAAPHGRQPRENLHTRWHGDDHGRRREVGPRTNVETNGEHVVSPDNEAYDADGRHGVGHTQVAEHGLVGEGGNDLADDAEGRNDDDVYFRVAKEPEQVLPQHRITPLTRNEERRAKVAVREQHGQGAGKHR